MPIYEYKCEGCGKIIEIFHKALEQESIPACPDCGNKNLKKVLSSPSMLKIEGSSTSGTTCCGSTERCDIPPCSDNGVCRRD